MAEHYGSFFHDICSEPMFYHVDDAFNRDDENAMTVLEINNNAPSIPIERITFTADHAKAFKSIVEEGKD